MYYSKILTELTKQEKNPVNKMYLSELSLKWKAFQQLTEKAFSNAELAEGISQFQSTLRNRKFMFSKIRGTGFYHNSKIFSANYLYDLIDALLQKRSILNKTGIKWDFQSINFGLELDNRSIQDTIETPKFDSFSSPPVLSLSLELDYQYRINGKRNFTKQLYNLPLLMFFAYKNLTDELMHNLAYLSNAVKLTCPFAKTFVICENISDSLENFIQRIPVQVFVLNVSDTDNKEIISKDMVDNLEQLIVDALENSPSLHLFMEAKPLKKKVKIERTPKTRSRKIYKKRN